MIVFWYGQQVSDAQFTVYESVRARYEDMPDSELIESEPKMQLENEHEACE